MAQVHEVMNLVIKGVISPIQFFPPNGSAYPINSTYPRLVIGFHFVVAQFISKFRIFYESLPGNPRLMYQYISTLMGEVINKILLIFSGLKNLGGGFWRPGFLDKNPLSF